MQVWLQGGKFFTLEARDSFERVTVEFYRLVFLNATGYMEARGLVDFDTDVTAREESVDASGNTITYDQSGLFITNGEMISETRAKELLMEPLMDEEKRQQYLELLQRDYAEFGSITAILPYPQFTMSPSVVNETLSPEIAPTLLDFAKCW